MAKRAGKTLRNERGQPLRRFVKQQHTRLRHQGARDREHLLLATAERASAAVGKGHELGKQVVSVSAAVQMLDDLADDEALSLRAVARAVSISPTSVYLYFPDRDALVAAAMQRCHAEMLQAADGARPGCRSIPASTR